MSTRSWSGRRKPRLAFSMCSSVLAIIAVATSLLLVHDWGKTAIPVIEWICGITIALWVASMIADWRRS